LGPPALGPVALFSTSRGVGRRVELNPGKKTNYVQLGEKIGPNSSPRLVYLNCFKVPAVGDCSEDQME